MESREREEKQREIDSYISTITNTGRYSKEIIALVKKDLEYGLTKNQVKQYLSKKWDITKSKVYSDCLLHGYPQEEIDVITADYLNGYQMQVALEFREKGVPINTIQEISNKNDSAKSMRSAFDSILNRSEELDQTGEQESEYVLDLIEQMKSIVSKIQYQEERYDALNKKLSIIETTKKDDEFRDNRLIENAEKDKLISEQQEELGKAHTKIADLRNDIEELEEQIKKMKQKNEGSYRDDMPVCFTVPILDSNGRVMQCISVDKTERKTSGLINLIANIGFKRKSRHSILNKVASGDLIPAQIIQLKSGIEKGLSEKQLLQLIQNNVSAEKMEVIIELVLAENKRNMVEV